MVAIHTPNCPSRLRGLVALAGLQTHHFQLSMPLAAEVLARRTAALAHVRKYGDPVLKTPARTVDRFDEALLDQSGAWAS